MGPTLQPGLRHSAKVEVSRDRTGRAVTFKVDGRDSGKAAKAGLS